MSATATTATTSPPEVKPPFDQITLGDIIIRTSDNAEFRVYRRILSAASTIFDDMFSIPQPATPNRGEPLSGMQSTETKCIDLSEDAETIDALLRCIYPVQKLPIQTTDLAVKVVHAADKYFIAESCLSPVYAHLRCAIKPDVVSNAPQVYAIGWRLGYKKITIRASREILSPSNDVEFETQLPSIVATSGDVQARLVLESARRVRDVNFQKIATLLSYRMGSYFCQSCIGQPNSILETDGRVKKALREVMTQEWRTAKSGNVDPAGFVAAVEGRVSATSFCQQCRAAAKRASLTILTVPSDVEIPRTISWPSNKADNSL